MHGFGTEKTICDFCHQGKSKITKSRTLKLLICKKKKKKREKKKKKKERKKKKKTKDVMFVCRLYFFLSDKNETP